jgi:glycosyltransferase involved in cell wall biosynthesis
MPESSLLNKYDTISLTAIDIPKISICIPAYNQTIYLARLLDSIAMQKFTDFEIIISDDSVTEDVGQLITKYDFGYKLKYFRNKKSLGSPANWNAAINKATGDYIKIMHHDDAFASNTALGEMISLMKAKDYDYVFADSKIENVKDAGQNRIHRIRKFDILIRKPYLLFFGNSIGGPSALLIKKKKFAELRYNHEFIWLVDIEYYIRLFHTSSNGVAISKPLILTHDAMEHRLTSSILGDFELQIKEQVMLYNLLFTKVPVISKFFMKVYLVRLFFKAKTKNKNLTAVFIHVPALLKVYFSFLKFKPLYFAYYIFIRILDITRKTLYT